MNITTNEKTPVAELGGERDEGLENPTPMKEQENMTIVSAAVPTRIELDERTAIDVEPIGEQVEITISTLGPMVNDWMPVRSTHGIAVTRTEARRLATALFDASAPSFADSDPTEIDEHINAVQATQRREVLTPAKAAARMKAVR